jgi:S-methylmethionine-dependent homocysteine/selenocysteine methylase
LSWFSFGWNGGLARVSPFWAGTKAMPMGASITILDGGMGRQLARMGAPFRLPEWSALALMEAPHFVSRAHQAFIASGAQLITTNSYGLAPSRIGETRFASDGRRLADLAGRLAREAADQADERVLVAGSLPPVFESYRPELFDAERAPAILDVLVSGLAPHVDLWLVETQSSTTEARAAIAAAARRSELPIWASFTLRDEVGREGPAELRSGEPVASAVRSMAEHGIQAILFNCSQPEVMDSAVLAAASVLADQVQETIRIGVYANTFTPEPHSDEPYAGISGLRDDLSPERYLEYAIQWVRSGATIVGGCCGIGPEHIAALRAQFRVVKAP